MANGSECSEQFPGGYRLPSVKLSKKTYGCDRSWALSTPRESIKRRQSALNIICNFAMYSHSSRSIWTLGLWFACFGKCLAHPTEAHSPRITTAPTLLEDRAAAAATTTDKVAASYSMTPASIPVLPLPTGALHAAEAQSFIEANWGYVSGESEYIAFAADPFDSTNKDRVFRVSYPAGSYANSPVGDGGVGMYLNPFGNVNAQRAMFTYEVWKADYTKRSN